jgi:hypothetical protein
MRSLAAGLSCVLAAGCSYLRTDEPMYETASCASSGAGPADGGAPGGGGDAGTLGFARDVAGTLSVRCALSGCHDAMARSGGLELYAPPVPVDGGTAPNFAAAQEVYAELVVRGDGGVRGVPAMETPTLNRVEPGSPTCSYLVRKLAGTSGIVGARMPLGGPFDDRLTRLVSDWVAEGAAP